MGASHERINLHVLCKRFGVRFRSQKTTTNARADVTGRGFGTTGYSTYFLTLSTILPHDLILPPNDWASSKNIFRGMKTCLILWKGRFAANSLGPFALPL